MAYHRVLIQHYSLEVSYYNTNYNVSLEVKYNIGRVDGQSPIYYSQKAERNKS